MSEYNHVIKRPEKITARNLACEYRGTKHKVALFLTVPKVPDIKLALTCGIITKFTTIIVVNDDADICSSIRKSLGRMGFRKFHVIEDKLQQSLGQLEALNIQIDYAFLDFCGGLSFAICAMFHNMQKILAPKCRIAMTICAKVRHRQFIDAYENAFSGFLHPDVTKMFATPLASLWVSDLVAGAYNTTRAKTRIIADVWYDTGIQEEKLADPLSVANIRRMERSNVVSNFVWQVQALWGSLSSNRMSITDSHVYHEAKQGATSMGFVQFDLTRTKDDPAKWEIVKRVVPCNAAHKAWDTRRRNSQTAARKAWDTRRRRYGKTGCGK